MSNPDPHPPVIRSEQSVDRPQPVVAGAATALFHPQLARTQIDLVMYDDDVRQQELEKAHGLADRLAGRIHEGLRLQQERPLPADRDLRELALEAVAKPGGAVPSGNRLDRHETDVVAVSGGAGPRVPE